MRELILYQTEGGEAKVCLSMEEKSTWLTQSEIADLFVLSSDYNFLQDSANSPNQ